MDSVYVARCCCAIRNIDRLGGVSAMNDDDEIALMWARLLLAAAAFVFVLLVAAIVITAGIDTAIQMLRIWK